MASDKISIEVAYARSEQQTLIKLSGEMPFTVDQAIEHSGMLERFPDIDLGVNKVGVYGKIVKLSDVLTEGDRVEIYRPLLRHPMQARRDRVRD